jgi:site-specific recombinase XerD
MNAHGNSPNLSQLLQDFFYQNLINQRNVSSRTIVAYRDTFRLLLQHASKGLGKPPTKMDLDDLDMPTILGFLTHLETDRRNSARTRNARLAAIPSFMHFAAYREPASLPGIQKVLSIPMKRFERPVLGSLTREEIDAILEAPNASRWSGQRDRAMFTVFYNTGARVSEVIAMKVKNFQLSPKASVQIHGKGRKERIVPLWKTTALILKSWMSQVDANSEASVFPNRLGKPLSASGIQYRLHLAVLKASNLCPTLRNREVSPHTIRHTTAMHLLQSGVDLAVIALWLGHESPSTTHMYMEADLTIKERALEKLHEAGGKPVRYKATDELLGFLERL